jgi:predicted RNA-binding Zn ribbon-like protein
VTESEWLAGNSNVRLCLDFANTVDWRTAAQPHELLTSYADLVAWGQRMDIVPGGTARRLLEESVRDPAQAAAVLERVIVLRESIYRIFSAVVAEHAPEAADIATLNRALAETLPRLQLAWTADGFAWRWNGDENALDQVLWPVARSAAELLTSDELSRVGVCAGDGCGWLFFDTSKNRSRRWCSMQDCGNRAKARRHYRRSRVQDRDDEGG